MTAREIATGAFLLGAFASMLFFTWCYTGSLMP